MFALIVINWTDYFLYVFQSSHISLENGDYVIASKNQYVL
jgi:hypothetical protein